MHVVCHSVYFVSKSVGKRVRESFSPNIDTCLSLFHSFLFTTACHESCKRNSIEATEIRQEETGRKEKTISGNLDDDQKEDTIPFDCQTT